MNRKLTIGLGGLALCGACSLVVLNAGKGRAPATGPTPAAETAATPAETTTTDVELAATGEIRNGWLIVRGTSNLPFGASIAYEIRDSAGDLLEDGQTPSGAGEFTINSEAIKDHAGPFGVWVAFQVFAMDQPSAVVDLFGKDGAKMSGPLVEETGGSQKIKRAAIEFKVSE